MILFVRIVSLFFVRSHLFTTHVFRSPNSSFFFTTKNL
nr:MAG TPA: hypothetical protein [Caudoviricetes sp.]